MRCLRYRAAIVSRGKMESHAMQSRGSIGNFGNVKQKSERLLLPIISRFSHFLINLLLIVKLIILQQILQPFSGEKNTTFDCSEWQFQMCGNFFVLVARNVHRKRHFVIICKTVDCVVDFLNCVRLYRRIDTRILRYV